MQNIFIVPAMQRGCRAKPLYTHMSEKETPGVLQIFTANFRGLNPKVKQIDRF